MTIPQCCLMLSTSIQRRFCINQYMTCQSRARSPLWPPTLNPLYLTKGLQPASSMLAIENLLVSVLSLPSASKALL